MPEAMQTRWRGQVLLAGALLFYLAFLVVPCGAQYSGSPIQNAGGGQQVQRPGRTMPPEMNPGLANDRSDPLAQQKWRRMFNQRRHDDMVADARKLLRLTAELKEEVVRTHATGLTDAELRKVAEIQKLARKVRENMTLTLGPRPGFPDQQLPPSMLPVLR